MDASNLIIDFGADSTYFSIANAQDLILVLFYDDSLLANK